MNNDRLLGRIQKNENLISIRDEKIDEINKALAIETDPERIFSYNKRIAIEKKYIADLEAEIDGWKSELGQIDNAAYYPPKISDCSVELHMSKVPTGFYHLLNGDNSPLISFNLVNNTHRDREFQCIGEILRYSDPSIIQVMCKAMSNATVNCLPTLIHEKVFQINELFGATVICEIRDRGTSELILKVTKEIELYSRNTALFALFDPAKAQWNDFTTFLAAWVTPNSPSIQSLLDKVRAHHPQKTLAGYQGGILSFERKRIVRDQASAIFDALKAEGIGYVNSVINFGTEPGDAMQRIRLPSECLKNKAANCIDGTVLFASILTAISLNSVIFIVPGHAFVGWETWDDSGEYEALETTLIGYSDFNQALASGNAQYHARLENGELNRPIYDRRGFLKQINIKDTIRMGITPQE